MNCQCFQEQLYEYVEGSLEPEAAAAAEEHLAACGACRELVSREQRASRVLSRHLQEAVAELKLGSNVTNRVLRAIECESSADTGESPIAWWRRWVVWRVAAGFGLLIGLAAIGLWIWDGNGKTSAAKVRDPVAEQEFISLEASYVVPVFTARRQGNLVIDAVTFQTNHVRQTLWAEARFGPLSKEPERKKSL